MTRSEVSANVLGTICGKKRPCTAMIMTLGNVKKGRAHDLVIQEGTFNFLYIIYESCFASLKPLLSYFECFSEHFVKSLEHIWALNSNDAAPRLPAIMRAMQINDSRIDFTLTASDLLSIMYNVTQK